MRPLNSNHLECLRSALELLDHGLKQNRLSLKPLTPSALDSAQAAKPAAVQPIAAEGSGVVEQPALVTDTAAQTSVPEQLPSLAYFNGLPWQASLVGPISTEAARAEAMPELQVTGRAYFQSVPWLIGTKTVITATSVADELSPVPLSGSFFKGIAWHKPSEVALQASPNEPVTAELAQLAEKTEVKGQAYFKSLPWATGFDKASATQHLAEALTPVSQAGSFFRDVAWVKPSAQSVESGTSVTSESLRVSRPQDQGLWASASYFKEIPWQSAITISNRQAKPDSDRSWMAELATQSALTAAARGAEKYQDKPQPDCQTYFQRVFLPKKAQKRRASRPKQDKSSVDQNVIAMDDKLKVLTSQNQHYFQKLPWNQL